MMQQIPNNPMQMIQQFNQFKNSFTGDPKQAVMNLLQSGQMNPQQLYHLRTLNDSFAGYDFTKNVIFADAIAELFQCQVLKHCFVPGKYILYRFKRTVSPTFS